jgi:citronellol/citronellal dehydrogenase
MTSLAGRTLFISGASRGIGLAIGLRAARDGANVALIAKTAEPHPRLEGTVYTAAEQIEAAGGQALPIVGDIRDEAQVAAAVEQAVERFGGIDVVINNASAIALQGTEQLELKRYDLMQDINARGTFVCSKLCIPHLRHGTNPHILTLSPPIDLDPKWLAHHGAYTLAKYGMTLLTLGMAEEFREAGIAANRVSSVMPYLASVYAPWCASHLGSRSIGGDEAMKRSRKPEIYADSAYAILTRPSHECTGNSFLCEDVLRDAGVEDLSPYSFAGSDADLQVDLFVDHV